MPGRALTVLRSGSFASRLVPLDLLVGLARFGGRLFGPRLMPAKAAQLRRHLGRVQPHGDPATLDRQVVAGYGSYGRYFAETFRIPHLSDRQLDRSFSFIGYWKIEQVKAAGHAPLLVLPHLGGWEWAAAWLGRVAGVGISAVVERLEPEEVFDWFTDHRTSYGVNVIPLGPDAVGELNAAIKRRDIVCLLSDRDIGGTGIEVDFFGETTRMPLGPAVLSSRTGSPLLPTAVYFRGRQRITVVGDPIWPEDIAAALEAGADAAGSGPGTGTGTGSGTDRPRIRGRAKFRAATVAVTDALEELIAQAPDQWHLLEPNWPSDREADGSADPETARPEPD